METRRNFFILGGWSNTGMGYLEMVISALSLSVFKGHLDNAINTMIKLLVIPEVLSQLGLMIAVDPFQLK